MAVDMFLKIDGIKGESKDHKHTGEIEIMSFSWGVAQMGTQGSGGGGGAGKVNIQDINFSKNMDTSSPLLLGACLTGKHLKKAVLYVRKAGEKPMEFYTATMEDILVSSYQVAGHSESPSENISFNFGKIMTNYKEQTATGGAGAGGDAGYDLKANKAT